MGQDMITGTVSSYKTDTRIGYRVILWKANIHKKQHLVCGDFCIHAKSREGSSQTIQRSSSGRVKTCNGRLLRILLMVPKPTYRGKSCSTSKRRNINSDGSVAYRMNGGSVRWDVVVTCEMRTRRWKTARLRMRTDLVYNSMDLLSRSEPKSATSPSLRTTRQGCINLEKCYPEYPWDLCYERGENGQDICSSRIAKTSRTCRPSDFHVAPRSRTREKAVVSMCRRTSQNLLDLPQPPRREMPNRGSPVKKKDRTPISRSPRGENLSKMKKKKMFFRWGKR